MQLPPARTTTNRLVINAPFEDRLRVTFVPQGNFPPLTSIVVSARYRDPGSSYEVDDVHSFGGPAEAWTWEVPLRDRSKRDFEYKIDVTYADGSAHPGEYRPGKEGTILVGDVAREMLDIEVVPAMLDMDTVWKLVIVRLRYEDSANGIGQEQVFKITASTAMQEFKWKVPLRDPQKRTFTYTIQAFGHDSANKKVVGPIESKDSIVVLEL
jgi:hypothetical protein